MSSVKSYESEVIMSINHEGWFPHECEQPTCTNIVNYDDEPRCFKHSPDSGCHVPGYSARRNAERERNGEVIF